MKEKTLTLTNTFNHYPVNGEVFYQVHEGVLDAIKFDSLRDRLIYDSFKMDFYDYFNETRCEINMIITNKITGEQTFVEYFTHPDKEIDSEMYYFAPVPYMWKPRTLSESLKDLNQLRFESEIIVKLLEKPELYVKPEDLNLFKTLLDQLIHDEEDKKIICDNNNILFPNLTYNEKKLDLIKNYFDKIHFKNQYKKYNRYPEYDKNDINLKIILNKINQLTDYYIPGFYLRTQTDYVTDSLTLWIADFNDNYLDDGKTLLKKIVLSCSKNHYLDILNVLSVSDSVVDKFFNVVDNVEDNQPDLYELYKLELQKLTESEVK